MLPNVATLSPADASWLGRWRTLPGYQACEVSGQIWVSGPESAEWALMPALARYSADDAGRLIPIGKRLPVAKLPEAAWQPLSEFLRVRPPAAALPALHVAPIAWALVPSDEYRAAEMLVLPFADFARWGLSAPAVRLQPLRFAVSEDGRACVIGTLLPTLSGQTWCVQDRIATPAGWALPKGITPALVTASMKLGHGELALLHPDGTSERLPAEAFVEVTRSALRTTKTSLAI